MTEHAASEGIDTAKAHPARMYDYLLGGTDNFEADRSSSFSVAKKRVGL